MRFVFVLENEERFQKDIAKALLVADPKLQIRFFEKLPDLAEWVKDLMNHDAKVMSVAGKNPIWLQQVPLIDEPHVLSLVVSKIEFVSGEQINLLTKLRELFISKGMATKEDPTAFVLTAFDHPDLKIKNLENRIFSNVILKPFDRLILEQHLIFALDGRHPPSKYSITNQKLTAKVEMLKEFKITEVSEIGFKSISYLKLDVGTTSKYYNEFFISKMHRSLVAKVVGCEKINETEFECTLRFFSPDSFQASEIRSKILNLNKEKKSIKDKFKILKKDDDKLAETPLNIIILDAEGDEIFKYVKRKFNPKNLIQYPNFQSFYLELDPQKAMQEADKNSVKPYTGKVPIRLTYDFLSQTIMSFEDEKVPQGIKFFDLPVKEVLLKQNFLLHYLTESSKNKFKVLVSLKETLTGSNGIFVFQKGALNFILRISEIKKLSPATVSVQFTELSKAELIEYRQKNSALPPTIDAIIFKDGFFGETGIERWTAIKEQAISKSKQHYSKFDHTELYLVSKQDYDDKAEIEMSTVLSNIFYLPMDFLYFGKALASDFVLNKKITEKQHNYEIESSPINLTGKAATEMQVEEVSEAGLITRYYRSVSIGAFREFVLWHPYEIGAPEMIATCNFVEQDTGEKKDFKLHFVFFAMSEVFLKQIRLWIRDTYVMSKEKGS